MDTTFKIIFASACAFIIYVILYTGWRPPPISPEFERGMNLGACIAGSYPNCFMLHLDDEKRKCD